MTGSYDKENDYLVVKPQLYNVKIRATATKSGATADAGFTFELVDICDPPLSLTAPVINDYSFNIRDNSRPTTTHDPFVVNPPQCTYTTEMTQTRLVNSQEDTVLYDYNSNDGIFTWDYLAEDSGPVLPDLQF